MGDTKGQHGGPVALIQRGGVYVAVLGVAVLVTVMGMGGLAASRTIARGLEAGAEQIKARRAAEAGLAMSRAVMETDSAWRSNRGSGVWFERMETGGGEAIVEVSSGTSEGDPAELVAVGVSGDSRHAMKVALEAKVAVAGCLKYAVFAGGSVSISAAIVLSSEAAIGANGSVSAVLSTVSAAVDAGGSVSGGAYLSETRSGAAVKTMPGAARMVEAYVARGTAISVSSLPKSSGRRLMQGALLGPGQNPFGAANAEGIYVVDAQGEDLELRDMRIVGTLVLLDPGAGSLVSGSVAWEPMENTMPALVVRGDLRFAMSASALQEGSGGIGNLNPAGAGYPYPLGAANATTGDSFASRIDGLVMVTGRLSVKTALTARALLALGDMDIEGSLTLAYDPVLGTSPPPGTTREVMTPAIGGYSQALVGGKP